MTEPLDQEDRASLTNLGTQDNRKPAPVVKTNPSDPPISVSEEQERARLLEKTGGDLVRADKPQGNLFDQPFAAATVDAVRNFGNRKSPITQTR